MVNIVIIHGGNSPKRLDNLKFTVGYYRKYLPNSHITVVEQNGNYAENIIIDYVDTYINYITYNSLFSRSLSFNIGRLYGDGTFNNTLFTDNDCCLSVDFFCNLQNYLPCMNDTIYLTYNRLIDMNEKQTILYVNQNTYENIDGLIVQFGSLSGRNNTYGGSLLINNTIFDNIGGYDNRFWGWGGEDDAMYEKMVNMFEVKRLSHTLYHLNHEKTIHCQDSNPQYEFNLAYLNEYRICTNMYDYIKSFNGLLDIFKHVKKINKKNVKKK